MLSFGDEIGQERFQLPCENSLAFQQRGNQAQGPALYAFCWPVCSWTPACPLFSACTIAVACPCSRLPTGLPTACSPFLPQFDSSGSDHIPFLLLGLQWLLNSQFKYPLPSFTKPSSHLPGRMDYIIYLTTIRLCL